MSDEPRCNGAAIRYAHGLSDPEFLLVGGSAIADLSWSDGTLSTFVWFHDEVSFKESEFIGKTLQEVHDLYREKDLAWLQS